MSEQSTNTKAPLRNERKRAREEHANSAYELQKHAALRGAAVWSIVGLASVFSAHHLIPGFRRQTLALKGLLTMAFTTTGLVLGAESALQNFEHKQRNHDNLIRNKAMRELGKRGIIASESEIQKWQEDLINKELELRRAQRST